MSCSINFTPTKLHCSIKLWMAFRPVSGFFCLRVHVYCTYMCTDKYVWALNWQKSSRISEKKKNLATLRISFRITQTLYSDITEIATLHQFEQLQSVAKGTDQSRRVFDLAYMETEKIRNLSASQNFMNVQWQWLSYCLWWYFLCLLK